MTQVDIIRAVQSIANPALDVAFGAITMLGAEESFVAIVAVLFWTVSKRLAMRIGVLLIVSSFANSGLKDLFRMPRPSPDDVRVIMPGTGGGYGFPSGHAQAATVFWGYLARAVSKRWFTAAVIALVFLIGLSRVYLGVHFPGDVVGGFCFGAIILVAYLWVTGRPELRAAASMPTWWLAAVVAAAPFALLVLYRSADALKMVGFLSGVGAGYVLEDRFVRSDECAPLATQILKIAVGLGGVFALRFGLKAVFAPEEPTLALVRYAAMAVWASLGAPFVFTRVLGPARRR
ncbi:MAG: phosphatase PAP2 family protein [Firmicutes bacterium]|nr:phosphatase PAP2 family protein [Bacillota bacterium]MDH7495739.1 phosphatase PAP2 family protein [Bacillota bacterium]